MAIRLIPTSEVLPALQRDYGSLYFPLEMPASAYRGTEAPVTVVGVANVLVVNASMPEALAYDITRLLIDKRSDLVAIHPEARHLAPESASSPSPAPFHPGAIKLYREKGVWKE